MDREIKFRLIKDDKVVGYEKHKMNKGNFKSSIFHSKWNDDVEGWEWSNINLLEDSFIDYDIKEQYTGLKDCNGKEIYEGDYDDSEDECLSIVVFKGGAFGLDHYNICERGEIALREFEPFDRYHVDGFDFTKNIHDNPIAGEFV